MSIRRWGPSPPASWFRRAQAGPALRIVVDPSTLTPAPAVGDTVDFTITEMDTVAGARRASAITGYSRSATGADVGALSKNVTSSSDLVSNSGAYEAEVVDLSGSVAGGLGGAGTGFVSARIDTVGISDTSGFDLRLPTTLQDELDLQTGCSFTVDDTPLLTFNTITQITLWSAADIQAHRLPRPPADRCVRLRRDHRHPDVRSPNRAGERQFGRLPVRDRQRPHASPPPR